jgi:hypothetical protein
MDVEIRTLQLVDALARHALASPTAADKMQ